MRPPTRSEKLAERVRELLRADPGRSDRSVAAEVRCSPTTVGKRRAELADAGELDIRVDRVEWTAVGVQASNGNGRPHPGSGNLIAPSEVGNARATKHGVDSEVRLAPLRLEGERMARRRWPWLDDARVALVADLTARVELARRWIEQQGTVVRNRRGEVFPVVDRLERWSTRLDALIRSLDVEAREREADGGEDLNSYVEAVLAESNRAPDG